MLCCWGGEPCWCSHGTAPHIGFEQFVKVCCAIWKQFAVQAFEFTFIAHSTNNIFTMLVVPSIRIHFCTEPSKRSDERPNHSLWMMVAMKHTVCNLNWPGAQHALQTVYESIHVCRWWVWFRQ